MKTTFHVHTQLAKLSYSEPDLQNFGKYKRQ